MTYLELNNIIQDAVASNSYLKSYHTGWRSDMNVSLGNDLNSDDKDLFPRLFIPSSPKGNGSNFEFKFIFEKLQESDNDNNKNIEDWSELIEQGKQFLKQLNIVLKSQNAYIQNLLIPFDTNSNVSNQRIIITWFDVTIITSNC